MMHYLEIIYLILAFLAIFLLGIIAGIAITTLLIV